MSELNSIKSTKLMTMVVELHDVGIAAIREVLDSADYGGLLTHIHNRVAQFFNRSEFEFISDTGKTLTDRKWDIDYLVEYREIDGIFVVVSCYATHIDHKVTFQIKITVDPPANDLVWSIQGPLYSIRYTPMNTWYVADWNHCNRHKWGTCEMCNCRFFWTATPNPLKHNIIWPTWNTKRTNDHLDDAVDRYRFG